MKTTKFIAAAVCFTIILSGCQKIDWEKDVDHTAQITIEKVEFPLGTLIVQVEDMLDIKDDQTLYRDPVTGELFIRNTFNIPAYNRDFPFDPSEYQPKDLRKINLLDQNQDLRAQATKFRNQWQDLKHIYDSVCALYPGQQTTIDAIISQYTGPFQDKYGVAFDPANAAVKLTGKYLKDSAKIESLIFDYDLSMNLRGEKAKIADFRLDSLLLTGAVFQADITTSEDIAIPAEWVKKVVFTLGNQVTFKSGNNVFDVFDAAGGKTFAWGQSFKINMGEFSLCMMKDRNPSSLVILEENVVDTFAMSVHVELGIEESQMITLQPEVEPVAWANLQGTLGSVKAVWGMFKGEEMDKFAVKHTVNVDSILGDIDNLHIQSTPFDEPNIQVNITTNGIAGNMLLDFQELYSVDSLGERHDADPVLKEIVVALDESTIGQNNTTEIILDNTDEGGHIEKLFSGSVPKLIGLDVKLKPNPNSVQILRADNKISVEGKGSMDLPFSFGNGLSVVYSDTVKDVNIGDIHPDSIQSLTKDWVSLPEKLNDSLRIVLYAIGDNGIQEDLMFELKMMDKDDKVIEFHEKHTLFFNAAQGTEHTYSIDSVLFVYDDLEKLSRCDHFSYDVKFSNPNASKFNAYEELKAYIYISIENAKASVNLQF